MIHSRNRCRDQQHCLMKDKLEFWENYWKIKKILLMKMNYLDRLRELLCQLEGEDRNSVRNKLMLIRENWCLIVVLFSRNNNNNNRSISSRISNSKRIICKMRLIMKMEFRRIKRAVKMFSHLKIPLNQRRMAFTKIIKIVKV